MAFREYTAYEPVSLAGDGATWPLDDLHVHVEVRKPVRRLVEVGDYDGPADAAVAADMIPAVWTAAQVAATSLALGGYLTSAVRKWRDKKVKLPEGTRLTLTLIADRDDDRRRSTEITISDISTKTADEITEEIRRTLMRYTAGSADKVALHERHRPADIAAARRYIPGRVRDMRPGQVAEMLDGGVSVNRYPMLAGLLDRFPELTKDLERHLRQRADRMDSPEESGT